MTDKPLTVDEYVGRAPAEVRPRLEQLRQAVRNGLPDAEEFVGWGVASYSVGHGRFHLGYGKGFVSIYPGPQAIGRFAAELAPYSTAKGTVRFPLDEDPPLDLVVRIARWCLHDQPATTDPRGTPRERHRMSERVRRALEEAGLMEAYLARPPYQRNDYLGWIERPKREATRRAHLAQMLDELERGDVYMRMPWGRKKESPSVT